MKRLSAWPNSSHARGDLGSRTVTNTSTSRALLGCGPGKEVDSRGSDTEPYLEKRIPQSALEPLFRRSEWRKTPHNPAKATAANRTAQKKTTEKPRSSRGSTQCPTVVRGDREESQSCSSLVLKAGIFRLLPKSCLGTGTDAPRWPMLHARGLEKATLLPPSTDRGSGKKDTRVAPRERSCVSKQGAPIFPKGQTPGGYQRT